MSIIGSNLLAGASGQNGYQISRSVRLRSSASAYFSRTPSAGNRKTWTWSGWIKRSKIGSAQRFFRAYGGADDNNNTAISFDGSDRLEIGGHTVNWRVSSAVFRDVSAYLHVVIVFNTPDATANNRMRIYVNNSELTSFSTLNNPSQNFDLAINGNYGHWLGANDGGSAPYFDGYLTDIHFIDGQALTPSSFGEINATTGVWSPKQYTGTYGTNGFKLNFSDNSAATSTAIGKDSSGNNNNWTPSNISVTSGVTYDSMLDVPTRWDDGGNGRGNYCTLNPLSTTAGTYSNCNLTYTGPSSWYRSNSTVSVNSGKWYWEVKIAVGPVGARNSGSQYNAFGWGLSSTLNSTTFVGVGGATDVLVLADSGFGNNFSGAWTDYGAVAINDVLAVAVDLDSNTFAFYKNNTQVSSGTIGMAAGTLITPIIVSYSASAGVMDANFGQRPFAYTPPAGFKALNTQNLNAGAVTTSGTFTGNASANGPMVWLNGTPTAMTINGNAVTFGTHADKTAGGFKVRSSSSSHNTAGSNTYSITTNSGVFKTANAQVNP